MYLYVIFELGNDVIFATAEQILYSMPACFMKAETFSSFHESGKVLFHRFVAQLNIVQIEYSLLISHAAEAEPGQILPFRTPCFHTCK